MNDHPAAPATTHDEPEEIVRPTTAPPTVALGAMLLMWSVQIGWVVALAGAVVLVLGLSRWLREVKRQWITHR